MKKEIIALILAGGQGSRLGVMTKDLAKPAVPFGGKYRIIDFTLSNCANSGIDTVGVLTQYQPLELINHIGIGTPWDLDRRNGGVTILPPFQASNGGDWYKGTANAIYQNTRFIDEYDPDYVLILSGDHIYKMDYNEMLIEHQKNKADATIAVINVPYEEASRFGIMNCDNGNKIVEFEEKPKEPKSTLASMGIYIFNWKVLKEYLRMDEMDVESANDFGKNIIPKMLNSNQKLYAYQFDGYWKDVGTLNSLWEANMDLISLENKLLAHDDKYKIYTVNPNLPPHYIGSSGVVNNSIINEGCVIFGQVINSIIFSNVVIGKDTIVENSVIMSNTTIGENCSIKKAMVGANVIMNDHMSIGNGSDLIVIKDYDHVVEQNLQK